MAPQKAPANRRARPSPPSSDQDQEDAALQARRERNRTAQNIFRRRRQAAEKAQAARLIRLEEVVEEMSFIFSGFVDEMLQDDAVRANPALTAGLQQTTARMLSLAHEVVGPDEAAAEAAAGNSPALIPGKQWKFSQGAWELYEEAPSQVVPVTSAPPPQAPAPPLPTTTTTSVAPDAVHTHYAPSSSSSSSSSSPLSVTVTAPSQPVAIPEIVATQASAPSATALVNITPPSSVDSPSIPPQVFGNGWDWVQRYSSYAPGSAAAAAAATAGYTLPSDSFAFRLAIRALSWAQTMLARGGDAQLPKGEFDRIFGSTLRFRPRDSLLARIRWILGPGKDQMYRVADLSAGRYGADRFSRSDLVALTGGDGLDKSPPYLSAMGVERQLLALGARIIDPETLEIDMASLSMVDDGYDVGDGSADQGQSQPQPDSWSFVDFFSMAPQQRLAQATPMRLSIELLVINLVQKAVCLLGGPGFPRSELMDAIKASLIIV